MVSNSYVHRYLCKNFVLFFQVHDLIKEFKREDMVIWGSRSSTVVDKLYKLVSLLNLSSITDSYFILSFCMGKITMELVIAYHFLNKMKTILKLFHSKLQIKSCFCHIFIFLKKISYCPFWYFHLTPFLFYLGCKGHDDTVLKWH